MRFVSLCQALRLAGAGGRQAKDGAGFREGGGGRAGGCDAGPGDGVRGGGQLGVDDGWGGIGCIAGAL